VSLNDYHIIAVVESWTTRDLKDSELCLDGYDMYREDKKPGKSGGILLYVKDTLKSVRFNKLASVGFEQSIWCIVELKSSRYLGTCYRSPSTCSSAENGERLLEPLDTAVKQSVEKFRSCPWVETETRPFWSETTAALSSQASSCLGAGHGTDVDNTVE